MRERESALDCTMCRHGCVHPIQKDQRSLEDRRKKTEVQSANPQLLSRIHRRLQVLLHDLST
jgi:hypothetical protein